MSDFKGYAFFAMLDRMQYINRWGLMRNSRTENIKEHGRTKSKILTIPFKKIKDYCQKENITINKT